VKLLVVGAGVLGSLYAAKLAQAGHDVSILARGDRAADLRDKGIVLEEAATGARTTTPIPVVERLDPEDVYDAALVMVRKDQLASILPILGANRGILSMLFMVNNAQGPELLIQGVGRERVLLGFAGAGGARAGNVVSYHVLPAWQQPTTLGELNGARTPRLERLAITLRQAGFPVAISTRMDAWLATHVAWSAPLVHALYMVGGSTHALARTRDGVVLWVRAVRESYQALGALGIPITPAVLRLFQVIPEPLLVAFLRRLLATPTAELVIARHANAARAEYVQLGDELGDLARRAEVPTPAFDRLRPFVDPSATPIAEGAGELPMHWEELGIWLAALIALILTTGRLLRR
jgi:2-dehydropantoate 2-reductase